MLLILFSLAEFIISLRKNEPAHFVYYKDFGIDIPQNLPLHGIDVSSHQGIIKWPEVKAMQEENVQIDFIFIKATEGLCNTDKQFKINWQEAGTQGFVRGAYHFFIATKSGKAQAKNFIKNVKLSAGDLPPIVDVEQLYGTSPKMMQKELKDYLSIVEAYYNVKPIIYSYATFYDNFLAANFDHYPLWVAHYLEENRPKVKRHWDFWQHSENAHIYGIQGNVDFNVFGGDTTAFKRLLIKK
ncbi:glycoside hydrolase family 25 protein [Arachidicoccus sp.]|uniref:glycoside hydrolase family 25 protein n=1 Tax=Arachidicoccus sp. TaxID=1872624 RepID=UPI003D1A7C63